MEIYNNYHLFLFKINDKYVEASSIDHAKEIIAKDIIVTFNGNKFDIPLLRYYLAGASTSQLKLAANDIINNEFSEWQFFRKYKVDQVTKINTIDLIEICPGHGSLKLYGARFHSKNLQELPFDPDKNLTSEEKKIIKEYCKNDIDITEMLMKKLEQPIALRRAMSNQFHIDLRSKSDSQIAEAIIKSRIGNIAKHTPQYQEFVYKIPEYIQFDNIKLKAIVEELKVSAFTVNQKGAISPPEVMKQSVSIGDSKYQLGMGGLHSQEQNTSHISDTEYLLSDWDVSSYYPSIILNLNLYPERIGKKFLDVYKSLVDERLDAKRNGDKSKADSLKITINGSFGKFGSIYSSLYAPELLIQTTVTGQLSLLMLIEQLESCDIRVVSANTDGIVCKCKRVDEQIMIDIMNEWQKVTRFELERTDYEGLYSRDVNNYLAIKSDKSVKTKGFLSSSGWQKNPANEICNEAVIKLLTDNIDIEKTVRSCKDVSKFLTVRTVNGGAVKDDVFIGKVIRWYYRKNDKTPIVYKTSGNQVASSMSAYPLMRISDEMPEDIDYDYYITEAKKIYDSLFEAPIIDKKTRTKTEAVKVSKVKKHKPQQYLF